MHDVIEARLGRPEREQKVEKAVPSEEKVEEQKVGDQKSHEAKSDKSEVLKKLESQRDDLSLQYAQVLMAVRDLEKREQGLYACISIINAQIAEEKKDHPQMPPGLRPVP